MSNLHKVFSKDSDVTTFVRISTNWSFDLTNERLTIFFSSFSFIKSLSISTCFVRSCWTGFPDMLIATLLSQNNLQVFVNGKCSSLKRFFNQRSQLFLLHTSGKKLICYETNAAVHYKRNIKWREKTREKNNRVYVAVPLKTAAYGQIRNFFKK